MILSDLHVHTTYCDGKSSIEEIARKADELGMTSLGFSGHGYTAFDDSYCMSPQKTQSYINEINSIKDKYHTNIYLGLEKDLYGENSHENFDYLIGSAHYVKKDGVYYPVDHSEELFAKCLKEVFGGDALSYCKNYYAGIAERLPLSGADILGHIDLVGKFNSGKKYFDEEDKSYQSAALEAVAVAKDVCPIVEMNTGAISRGYRHSPYPRKFILDYIRTHNMQIILNSDSHHKDNLCFKFDLCIEILKNAGFKNVVALIDGKFQEVGI